MNSIAKILAATIGSKGFDLINDTNVHTGKWDFIVPVFNSTDLTLQLVGKFLCPTALSDSLTSTGARGGGNIILPGTEPVIGPFDSIQIDGTSGITSVVAYRSYKTKESYLD